MKNISIIKLCFLLSILVVATGVFAMSMGNIGKVCLFSAMSGTITLDGKPVVNAKLVRTADRDGAKTDETMTDENGYFQFPAMFERTITKFLPQEFVVSQKVVLYFDEQEYEIWWGIKRKPEENIESRGKPLVVNCELSNSNASVMIDASSFHGLCRWDVESDKPIDWDEIDPFESDSK